MQERKQYKTVVLSDLHLGSQFSKVKEASDFLSSVDCDQLVLNGDTIDGWQLQKKENAFWGAEQARFFRIIMKMVEKCNTRVFVIRGNHDDFLDKIKAIGKDDTEDFYTLYERIHGLYRHTVNDNWPECLNHCDALAANFLISSNECGEMEMTLIDWEYSGQGDTAQDLGSFIACSDMNYEEAMLAIRVYLGHEPSNEELRHFLAYTAIASYCWYLWAIYQESNGVDTGGFLKLWYDYSYLYSEKALNLYSAE